MLSNEQIQQLVNKVSNEKSENPFDLVNDKENAFKSIKEIRTSASGVDRFETNNNNSGLNGKNIVLLGGAEGREFGPEKRKYVVLKVLFFKDNDWKNGVQGTISLSVLKNTFVPIDSDERVPFIGGCEDMTEREILERLLEQGQYLRNTGSVQSKKYIFKDNHPVQDTQINENGDTVPKKKKVYTYVIDTLPQ